MSRLVNNFALLAAAAILGACDAALPVHPAASDPDSTGNHRPTAAILGTTGTFEGIAANFSAVRSADADDDSLTYWWDFGDGTKRLGAVQEEHAYADNGDYTVTLIVTDAHHAADTATQAVTIQNMAPVLDSFAFAVPAGATALPAQASVAFRVSDLGANDHPVAEVDWGDGVVTELTTHTYTKPGAYRITVRARDKDGGADSLWLLQPVWIYDPKQQVVTAPSYQAVDLGTLGGARVLPTALNNLGEVVGSSNVTSGSPATSYTGSISLPPGHAFLWRNGVMSDIAPSGVTESVAQTINDAGWIAGMAGWPTPAGRANGVVTWRNGSVVDVTQSNGENGADAVAVNPSGEVVVNVMGHEYPTSYLLRDGSLSGIGGLGDPRYSQYTWASDRNSRGEIVGTSVIGFLMTQADVDHAFRWSDGVMKDLGALAKFPCDSDGVQTQCSYSEATAINDQGQIVGVSRNAAMTNRAVVWTSATVAPSDLGFGVGRSRAVAINDQGQIAGDAYGAGDAYFRDTNGSITTLGSLGGGHTQVVAMNNGGVVTGVSLTSSGDVHAFVWQLGLGMRDLGIGPLGVNGLGSVPVAINDRGDIVGVTLPACHDAQFISTCLLWDSVPMRAVLWRVVGEGASGAR